MLHDHHSVFHRKRLHLMHPKLQKNNYRHEGNFIVSAVRFKWKIKHRVIIGSHTSTINECILHDKLTKIEYFTRHSVILYDKNNFYMSFHFSIILL